MSNLRGYWTKKKTMHFLFILYRKSIFSRTFFRPNFPAEKCCWWAKFKFAPILAAKSVKCFVGVVYKKPFPPRFWAYFCPSQTNLYDKWQRVKCVCTFAGHRKWQTLTDMLRKLLDYQFLEQNQKPNVRCSRVSRWKTKKIMILPCQTFQNYR